MSTSISRRSWYFSHWNSIQLETRRNVKSIAKSILKRSSIKLFSDLNSVHHLLVLVYILLWYIMGIYLEISKFLPINNNYISWDTSNYLLQLLTISKKWDCLWIKSVTCKVVNRPIPVVEIAAGGWGKLLLFCTV